MLRRVEVATKKWMSSTSHVGSNGYHKLNEWLSVCEENVDEIPPKMPLVIRIDRRGVVRTAPAGYESECFETLPELWQSSSECDNITAIDYKKKQ